MSNYERLFEQLEKSVPSEECELELRGEKFRVLIKVLSAAETKKACFFAEQLVKKDVKDEQISTKNYEDMLKNAQIIEVIHRAYRRVDNVNEYFFPSPRFLETNLTTDELALLFNQYIYVQTVQSELVNELNEDGLDSVIDRITNAAKDSTFFLNSYSSAVLITIIMRMAEQLQSRT